MAKLRVLKGPPTEAAVLKLDPTAKFPGQGIKIGRDVTKPNGGVICDESGMVRKFVLPHGTVSSNHAAIEFDGSDYFLIDTNSRNHTYVDDEKLEPYAPCKLHDQALIRICRFLLTFSLEDTDSGSHSDSPVRIAEEDTSQDSRALLIVESSIDRRQTQTASQSKEKLLRLIHFTARLSSQVDLADLEQCLLDELLNLFPDARRGIILLWEDEQDEPTRSAWADRERPFAAEPTVVRSVVNAVRDEQQSLLVEDGHQMCVPLIDRSERSIGLLQLESAAKDKPFEKDDLDLFESAAAQASLVMENFLLRAAATREKLMARELQTAREMQFGLLPGDPPQLSRYQFYDYYAPARYLSGDYFDYITLPDGRVAIALGDVAGKGVSAALLMVKISTELRVYLERGFSPVDVFNEINRRFDTRCPEGNFVTMVVAVLDLLENKITLVNAGHLRPLMRRARTNEILTLGDEIGGLPLGVDSDSQYEYESADFDLEDGDTLIMISDGITDAESAAGQHYQEGRLRKAFAEATGNAELIGRKIMGDVEKFVGEHAQNDDRCLVCVQRDDGYLLPTGSPKETSSEMPIP